MVLLFPSSIHILNNKKGRTRYVLRLTRTFRLNNVKYVTFFILFSNPLASRQQFYVLSTRSLSILTYNTSMCDLCT